MGCFYKISSVISSHNLSVQYLLGVVPVIGILRNRKAFKPTPNPGEVEEVFDAPLEMFLKVFSHTI